MLKSVLISRLSAVMLALALCPSLRAADTAPATPPTADYSGPRQTMKTFLQAQDKAALLEALAVAPADKANVDSFLDVMDLSTKLQKAADAEFGAAAAKYFSDATGKELAAKLKVIDTADMRIDGNSATVNMPADSAAMQAAAMVKLTKIGSAWKIDAASLFSLSGAAPSDTARRVEIAHALATVTTQTIADIKGRKFSSAGEAYQEYWNRSRDAVTRIAATMPGAPATRP